MRQKEKQSALTPELDKLERLGRLLALIPTKNLILVGQEQKSNLYLFRIKGHESTKACGALSPWIIIISLVLVLVESLHIWDNLKLGYFKKNSQRIHYATFELALWIAGALSRTAFLISANNFLIFFCRAKDYLKEHLNEKELNLPTTKVVSRFKFMALFLLNSIFVAQIVEFSARIFSNYAKNHPLNLYCERILVPCNADEYYWVRSVLSVLVKVISSSSLYFLTYFVISMSHLLMNVLKGFRKDVENFVGQTDQIEDKWLNKTESGDNMDWKLITPIFILKGGSIDPKTGAKTAPRPSNHQNEPILIGDKKDLHLQFTELKKLFKSFNTALGLPLVTACLADVLVFICICFMLLPNFQHSGVQGENNMNLPTTFFSGEPPLNENNQRVAYNIDAYQNQSIEPHYPEVNFDGHNETGSVSETDTSASGQNSFGGGGMGAPDEYMLSHKYSESNSSLEGGVFYGFMYAFGVIYECRVILLAVVGSYLKMQVIGLKEFLDETCTIGRESRSMARKMVFKRAEEYHGHKELEFLLQRIDKWHWQLKPLDMINVDLGLLPTMLGTVMTYVVVLLQIQISEIDK